VRPVHANAPLVETLQLTEYTGDFPTSVFFDVLRFVREDV
jgi:hypothetical protein